MGGFSSNERYDTENIWINISEVTNNWNVQRAGESQYGSDYETVFWQERSYQGGEPETKEIEVWVSSKEGAKLRDRQDLEDKLNQFITPETGIESYEILHEQRTPDNYLE